MSQDSPAFQEAFAILKKEPLTMADLTRLEELEADIRPDEQEKYGYLYEGYFAAADLSNDENQNNASEAL